MALPWLTGVLRTPDEARAKNSSVTWVVLDSAFDDAIRHAGKAVNLASRHPFQQSWSNDFKAAMRESRINLTRRVVAALADSPERGKVLVSGSGYPVYGETGDDAIKESRPVSHDSFIASLDADWEEAARAREASGIRVVLARTGLVFGTDGDAFSVPNRPFDGGGGILLGRRRAVDRVDPYDRYGKPLFRNAYRSTLSGTGECGGTIVQNPARF